MLNVLIDALREAKVPNRLQLKHWEEIGYIGSATQEVGTVEVTLDEANYKFCICWLQKINDWTVTVEFDLVTNKIHYSCPNSERRYSLFTQRLTKDNVYYTAVSWFHLMSMLVKDLLND